MTITSAVKETAYKNKFQEFTAANGDDSLIVLRKKAFAAFEAAGFPTQHNEDWKYTSVTPIADEQFRISEPISDDADPALLEKFNYQRNGFTALNLAFARHHVIRIPSETVIDEPMIFNFNADEGEAIFPHIVILAEAGSKATIVENYAATGRGSTNAAVQIFVEDNAGLTHYRVQKDSPEAFNYGVTEVSLGRGSSYNSTNINLGAAISRHDIDVKFTAEGGEAWVDGLYMLSGGQHHDTHSIIDHTVPNCISHQTYRGVLNDNSRGVFNGIVFVRENAHGTDAQQSNKNLLLSNDARVDTKPQLEIFNDDVKCSHGATVGQLEEEELFYLLTRGIPESLAKNLLTYGFAEAVIDKIEIDGIKQELDSMVLNRLGAEI